MDFRDVQETGASNVMISEQADLLEAPAKAAETATAKLAETMASAAAEETSRTVRPQLFPIQKDDSRDDLLTDFGKETLKDRYLLPGESFQDLFVRVASAYADDTAHAQRIYDYISRLWFMPATPVLSNGGTGRGLPISCYLNSVDDSLEGIVNTWNENVWLASRGGGIGTYRSEGHTSELQSLMRISYAVFCLKKNNNTQTQ